MLVFILADNVGYGGLGSYRPVGLYLPSSYESLLARKCQLFILRLLNPDSKETIAD
jgi:hypothetical protein